MADSILETGDPQTQETKDTIFDNDNDSVENSLLQKFSPKEPEEEPEEEETEEEEEAEAEEVEATEEDDSSDEEDDESEDDEEEFEEGKAYSKEAYQKAVEKRINRYRKRLEEEYNDKMGKLDEKLSQLEGKIKEAETPTDAISIVKTTTSLKDLDKVEDDAEKTIDFVEDNPDGFTLNEGTENERYMDRKELLEMRKNARGAIKAAKSRRKFIEKKNAVDSGIYEKIPQLKDKSSEEFQAVQQVYSLAPDLKNHEQGTYLALCILEGDRVLTAPAKAKKTTKPKKAPKLPDSKPTPKKSADSTIKRSDLSSAISQGGDQQSLEEALLNRFSS
jgi:hypothetical protein